MDEKLKQVKQTLMKYGQEQLLDEYNRLTDEKQKQNFLDSILTIDFNQVKTLYEQSKKDPVFKNSNIEPIEYVDKSKLTKEEYEELKEIGTKQIKDKKLAVVTMAGGQGTRLGHTGPKGTFDLGLDNHKSLFEILTDILIKAKKDYGVNIPWYIMTSEENNNDTKKFFEENNYFGYPKECIIFFKQGELPMTTTEGKLFIGEKHKIKEASDGHGGIFSSMLKEGIIFDMKARGVEWVFVGGVDNVLVKPIDPILIGLAVKKNVLAAGKSIIKANPSEKVGVFCKRNGKPSVIEYSEITKEMAEMKDKNGELVYGESHILCNLFNIQAIEKVSQMNLPYHIAFKKAKYIDKDGNLVKPEKCNAYKYELFLFDAFEALEDIAILRVKREEEFAPVKNCDGVDSPETARKLYMDYMSKGEYLKRYEEWLNNPSFDEETKKELNEIKGNDKEIEDRFYKELEFGTAGLRGVIGAGLNRMNKYTVGRATQGLANFILSQGTEEKGVAISFDSRHKSKEFSEIAALCLNANGIKTYVFESLRPVPELSFAVRQLKCTAGIMITASHNPPEYNGYKVYWDDGAQIVPPKDKQIIDEVKNTEFSQIKTMDKQTAVDNGLYIEIGKEIDDKFVNTLKSLVLNPEAIKQVADELKIVYTPLHGAGNIPVQRVLKELGFNKVYVVPEQEMPNGDFPTVSYPNPEDKNSFKLALELAKKVDADIILANDPDADRLGIFSKGLNGEYIFYTGNMSALLIAEYELSQRKEKGILPENGAFITTIVSSDMAKAIAKEYNLQVFETLTGFKWIGEKIRQFEEQNTYSYQFGFEESYGCLISPHARDKDGISAVMALCEAAAYYKTKGFSLWEQMINIYKKYGYYKEGQISIVEKGIDGAEKIKSTMDRIRKNPPKQLADFDVLEVRDYEEHTIVKSNGEKSETYLPTSNVLYYNLTDNAWCCVRPSGTEPKIKFYMGVCGTSMENAEEKLEKLTEAMKKVVE